jgi:hypothetical protein
MNIIIFLSFQSVLSECDKFLFILRVYKTLNFSLILTLHFFVNFQVQSVNTLIVLLILLLHQSLVDLFTHV